MASRTHYEVLGVSPSADRPTIEKAYRRRVRFVHPDVCDKPDSLEKFYTIQRAYEVLRETDKRRAYDAELVAKSAAPANPVVSKRAATRRRAAEAREQSGVSNPGGFVSSTGPFWDPASNPVLRKKIRKSRNRKWLARLENAMLITNVVLTVAAIALGAWHFLSPEATKPVGVNGTWVAPAIDPSEPTEVERWLDPMLPRTLKGTTIDPAGIDPGETQLDVLGVDDQLPGLE